LRVGLGDLRCECLGVLLCECDLLGEAVDLLCQIWEFIFFLLCGLQIILEFVVLFHEFVVLELAKIQGERYVVSRV
jgi:hypothetical protein